MNIETKQTSVRVQPLALLLPQSTNRERSGTIYSIPNLIDPPLTREEHVISHLTTAEPISLEGIHVHAFGRQWVEHLLPHSSEGPEPPTDQTQSPVLRQARSGSQWTAVWRTNFMPIIIAGLGGLMIGTLFLLVTAAAVLVQSWAYAITFGFIGVSLVFAPVSIIIAYLWRMTPDPTADSDPSEQQT